ncbi:MAG: SDR family NAD(P)-dependent oxidoreductase [Burkholderiales bacterium]|jgi:NAD(P)-dependent dehydrogenase (short-subunit alcohol dehydrogenase family)
MNRVDDRIALVTGAAGGIGTATCRLLADGGAKVIATDLKAAPGEALAAAIDAAGGRIRYQRHDVTDDAQWGAVLEATLAAHGRLDVLVNNAGLFMHGRTEDADAASIDRLFDVNLKGVVLGTQHAFRAMKSRSRDLPLASIVNLSSVAGLKGSQMASLYCLTKGGVRLFSKSCAIEAAHLGYRIRVNSIHPGIIDTEMAQGVAAGMRANGVPPEQIDRMMAGAHPLGRMGLPADVARGVVFLASDDSAFVTGTELVVDGGMTAR